MKEDLSGLGLSELLGRLESLPEPTAVSLWPQTEAWLWLGLVSVLLAIWLIRKGWLHRRASAYRRVAMREIAQAAESPALLAEILRRTALAAFPRAEVAGLYGKDWLAFLDRTAGGSEFTEGVGRAFAQAAYTEQTAEAARLAKLAAYWVRRHRRDPQDRS